MSRRLHIPRARLGGETVALDADEVSYLGRVLRLSPGEVLEVFDGEGGVYAATVDHLEKKTGALRLGPREDGLPVPPRFVLLQGLAKGEKLEEVIQHATELGITDVWPVACARSVVRLDPERAEKRVARWQKIASEAARQCGRADVPDILAPRPVESALAALEAVPVALTRWVAWEDAGGDAIGLEAASRLPAQGHALLVGPEGGLTPEEVEAARARGFQVLQLGRRILRTETAALTVLAAVRAGQGELG